MNLKFRVWHKPSKKFVQARQSFHLGLEIYFDDGDLTIDYDGNLIYYSFGGAVYIHKEKRDENETVLSDYIIQRYTGMKDSCGVEVYEGDIVEKDNQTAEVFWNDTIGGFDLAYEFQIGSSYLTDEFGFQFNARNLLTMKVVGHINGI